MIDYNYFDNIDTEEKAYWLGFFFADGCIATPSRKRKDGTIKNGIYRIELSLSNTDYNHMEKYNKALGIEKPIPVTKTNFKTDRCRSYFNNKHMWEILNSYGCTPCKSLTLKFPDIKIFKNKYLIKHFIRGYVDGDGCLSYSDKDKKRPLLNILGTEHFLINLQHWLPLQFENKIHKKDDKNCNIFTLSFNCSTAFYITNYLYKNNNINLERKNDKYLEYCRLYEKSYGLQLGKYGELWEENTVVTNQITKG